MFNDDPMIAAMLAARQRDDADAGAIADALRQVFKGDKGDTPEKGVDYFTDEEVKDIIQRATPVKFKDYFTDAEIEAMMQQIYTAILKDLKNGLKDELTPVKGRDYKDGADGRDGVDGKDGRDGRDGVDGKDADLAALPSINRMIDDLSKDEKEALAKKLGGMIDISQIRNATSFMMKGSKVKYKIEELMHGGGSSTGGGTSVATQVVTAVQVGDDATVNLTQLANTFTGIVYISAVGRIYTPGSTDPGEGYTLVGSTATLYGTSATSQIVVSYTY